MSSKLIDAHQHIWSHSRHEYSWITPDIEDLLGHDYCQEDIADSAKELGITGSVYIQAADTYEDTIAMFESARRNPQILGIVGWVPLDQPEEADAALAFFSTDKRFKGVRNLTHDYGNAKYDSDDAWINRPKVRETIKVLESKGLSLDYVATKPEHVIQIEKIAKDFPKLKIVIDHFAKPDIKNHQWDDWLSAMKLAAEHKNVFTKFSGLNVLSDWEKWTIDDWRPYLTAMIEVFQSNRIMTGGDWPFSSMANDFSTVWRAQLQLIGELPESDQENIKFRTATSFYRLD